MSNSNKSNPKVCLIFPPVWDTDMPFLSLPLLSSYLTMHGINCKIIDANILFWEYITTSDKINEFKVWLNSFLGKEKRKITLDYYLLLKKFVSDDVEGIIIKYNSDINYRWELRKAMSFYEWKRYELLYGEEIISEYYLGYHDQYFHQISLSAYSRSSKMLSQLLSKYNNTIFHEFYSFVLKQKIGEINPDVIGISITAPNQVVPSFVFADQFKIDYNDVKVIAGGSWCTLLKDQISTIPSLYDYFDCFVYHEGELPLLELCKKLDRKQDWISIPNISFKLNDRIFYKNNPLKLNLDELPTPTFEDYTLLKYDIKNALPLQASRGCNWGLCEFCSYTFLGSSYRHRNAELVLNDINNYSNKYGTTHICFTDSILSMDVIKSWPKIFKEKIGGITWQAFMKVSGNYEQELFDNLYDIGCRMLIWGIESGSNKILKSIKKGTSVKSAEENLQKSSLSNIHNRVCMMYGFPQEQSMDRSLSLKFLESNIKNIQSLSFGQFTLEKYTPIFNEYIQNHPEILDSEFDLAIGFPSYGNLEFENQTMFVNKITELAILIDQNRMKNESSFALTTNYSECSI